MAKSSKPNTVTYVIREGRLEEAGEAFRAWTSGDLDRMVRALGEKANPIDRHYLLMSIVESTYKKRSDPAMAALCTDVAEKHLSEFPSIAPVLKRETGGHCPRVPTFQHYATLLTERRDYQRAIEVCEEAFRLGLVDGTKSGFAGRIERIKKKQKSGET